MTIKNDLMTLKKDITAIGKKLEMFLKAVEKSETKVVKISKAGFVVKIKLLGRDRNFRPV